MLFRSLLPAALLAAAASWATAGAEARLSSGELLQEARRTSANQSAAAGDPTEPEEALWVSLGRSDLAELARSPFSLGSPVMSSAKVSVFRVEEHRLANLSSHMHERFGRCGGFFAHLSREEALADLEAPPASAGGPYVLDQQAWVKPLAQGVREADLRATIETLTAFNNRYFQADSGVEAARWLQSRWQSLAAGLPGASVELLGHERWKQPSVVLTIPGTDKADEIVVLGGHLDSINGWGGSEARAPGADDNASGIAVLTEAVRLLGEARLKPRRTVKFIGYAAEEVGLRGSKEIAQRHAQEGAKVAGVLQFDMTNFKGSSQAIYLLDDYVDPALTAFLGELIDAYVGVPWSKTKCGYGCSDHASWTRSGFPASAAFEASFEGRNRKIHTSDDTLSNAGGSAEHSANFAKLAVAFAVEMAKASRR